MHSFVTDAITINLAINIQTRCRLELNSSKRIRLRSADIDLDQSFASLDDLLSTTDEKLLFLQRLLAYVSPSQGFEMETSSDSPVGGGLGGSSSLTISILKAFQKAGELKNYGSIEAMTQVAANLEASILRTPTGTQDYVPAIAGGLNIIRYGIDGFQVETRSIPRDLAQNFVLVYTGRSHHSGINNFEVLQRSVGGDQKVLLALRSLRSVSRDLLEVLDSGTYESMPSILSRELAARLDLAKSFASPEIRELQAVASRFGNCQVKICGAGGGGCVLLWAPPEDHKKIREACAQGGFRILDFKPVEPLSRS